MMWSGTRFCHMKSGNTIIFGKKIVDPESRGPGIYVYSSDGKKKKRLEDVCEHKETKRNELFSVEVDKSEYILITCVDCKKIFLLNIDSGKYYLSFENKDATFGPVCKGEAKDVYVVARKQGQATQSIFNLDCTLKRFSQKKRLNTEIKNEVALATYISSVSCLLLLEQGTNKTIAVSCKTGEKQWQLDEKVKGSPYLPKCLATYSCRRADGGSHDAIVAADGFDKLSVFSSTDGTFKHELNQNKFKDVKSIQCVDDTLVALQSRENAVAICLLKMKYEFESSV